MWKKIDWKTGMRKVCCLAAAVILIMQWRGTTVLAAQYWPEGTESVSPNAIVMELSTGTILYEKESLEKHYPASITKIMTTLVALEQSDLSEIVTFSDESIDNTMGSGIARDYGEQMTMEQCLYAVMLESANECAYAVAEHIGGTMENFVQMMNQKAEEIGCKNTHFVNPHGLHEEDHYTCAYDMALISQAAYENETFRIIIGTARYTIPPTNKHDVPTILQNHNEILYPRRETKYVRDYCTGGKTGYTDAANSTLVTFGEKDGLTLVCVVMNTQSPNQWSDTIQLLEYCFDNFQILNVKENETSYDAEEEKESGSFRKNEPFVDIDKTACIVLPKTAEFKDAASEITYEEESGEAVGTIVYSYADRVVGKAQIVATGVQIQGYVFDNQVEPEEVAEAMEQTAESGSNVPKTPFKAVMVGGGIAALLAAGYFLKKFWDNFYIIKHNMEVKRSRRAQFKAIKKRSARRRRYR